ncbi:MAG TPA: SCO1664 family protein [Anaerolineae bacterium]|nr:SCO1664 family protein [Anaerolineae bacterium]
MADSAIRASAEQPPLSIESASHLLAHGELELQGLIPWSSNYTYLAVVTQDDLQTLAVYKPCRGERPLWDFPSGTLADRELAAYVVSQALDWRLVPPTVLRDGPHGRGSLQFYIHADPDEHYFTCGKKFPEQFKQIAVFDALINNADRKAGHCLCDADNHIWAIDHGICFHAESKLRTVIWEFAGEPIPAQLLDDVRRFRAHLSSRSDAVTKTLNRLLAREEMAALRRRADQLIAAARFPNPGSHRHIPWPPV